MAHLVKYRQYMQYMQYVNGRRSIGERAAHLCLESTRAWHTASGMGSGMWRGMMTGRQNWVEGEEEPICL